MTRRHPPHTCAPPILPASALTFLATTTPTKQNDATAKVCVNGMSFSKRESKWANAALVVSLSPEDVARDVAAAEGADAGDSPLRGVRWQSAMERRAAEMGGGNLGEAFGRGFGVGLFVWCIGSLICFHNVA